MIQLDYDPSLSAVILLVWEQNGHLAHTQKNRIICNGSLLADPIQQHTTPEKSTIKTQNWKRKKIHVDYHMHTGPLLERLRAGSQVATLKEK